MPSKEALEKMLTDLIWYESYFADCGYYDNKEQFDIIKKDLDQLEKLKKVIKFLKLNFDISLDSKLRISDESECAQTFVTYLPENTTIEEMFEALREVLENDKRI